MPPPPPPPKLVLTLTTPSLRNVTIATPSDKFYYEIRTPEWDALYTKIRKLDPETAENPVIVELKREQKNGKYIGLRFSKPGEDEKAFIPPEEFLFEDPDAAGSKSLGSFVGDNGKQYRWQVVKGSTELVRADDTEGKTVARFHKHHRHLGVLRISQKPYIDAESELEATMNTLIVSFLLAEEKRRA